MFDLQGVKNAIKILASDKKIPEESIIEAIKSALASAYRKDFGNKQQNLEVDVDFDTGEIQIRDVKTVVSDEIYEKYLQEQKEKEEGKKIEKEKTEDEVRFNPKTMIALSEAKKENPDIKEGDQLIRKLEIPGDFGRVAAQTAKQVIIQKIREAERHQVYLQFKEKEGQLITGMVQRIERNAVLIDIDRNTAILPKTEQIPSERYNIGERMKFYIKEVNLAPKGPEIILSRKDPEMIKQLFVSEVPEISAGVVEIKSIAREAGSRTKIAVSANDENIDPIGACIGQRGSRIQTIIAELGGFEKIDVVEYSDDPAKYVLNALSPAQVNRVEVSLDDKHAKAFVSENQLSLAIGRNGQNVRLAANLTGYRIDIIEEQSGKLQMSSYQDQEEVGDGEGENNKESDEAKEDGNNNDEEQVQDKSNTKEGNEKDNSEDNSNKDENVKNNNTEEDTEGDEENKK